MSGWDEQLVEAETRLQEYLVRRPPAFFIQRTLNLVHVPMEQRVDLLQQIFPTVRDLKGMTFAAMADAIAYTQRDDVACLNRYFYAELPAQLGQTITRVRELLKFARIETDEDRIYTATELLAYLLVEKGYWDFISQPLVALHFDPAVMEEAGKLVAVAKNGARARRDWLRWHRLAANQARLGFLARDQSPQLSLQFDEALSLGQLCLDHGFELDRAFNLRRDELLHMAGMVKYFLEDPSYPNLCGHIKAPARIKPHPGGPRLTIESGKLIGNFSIPLIFEMEERFRRVGPHTAYLDFLALEDRLQVWVAYKGKFQGHSFTYRQLHQLENLDLIFRPNQFEVLLKDADKPFDDEQDPGSSSVDGTRQEERIAYVGQSFLAGGADPLSSSVAAGKEWVMRFPVVEVGFDDQGRPYHQEHTPKLSGVPWERTLGVLLAKVLPQDADLRHLVVSADGPLALLPLHLALFDDKHLLFDRYVVSYAPSLGYFSPAPPIRREEGPRVTVVMNSRNRLQGPIWESQRLKGYLGAGAVLVLDGFEKDTEVLQSCLADRDILHIATHGEIFSDAPDKTGIELSDNRTLTIRAIEGLTMKPGSLVFLNACSSSRVQIRSRIDFSSIANAFLAAGAATVVATFWETGDVAAALISDRFYQNLLVEGRGRLESLYLALDWVRTLDLHDLKGKNMNLASLAEFFPEDWKHPYRNPAHWGPFALFGQW